MPILIRDLIARVPVEVEEIVKNIQKQNRATLQDALRKECRLLMRTPEASEGDGSGAKVPVFVETGYPAILDEIEFPDNFDLIIFPFPVKKIRS